MDNRGNGIDYIIENEGISDKFKDIVNLQCKNINNILKLDNKMKDKEKHKVVRVDNLMYKGCEPHWKCVKCGICIPFHCYTKEQLENMYCKENKNER